jgi:hypothetical protein
VKRTPLKRKSGTSVAKEKAKATKLWGQYIHARDEVCQVCGGGDGKLDAHHIIVREFNATRTDELNGMLVHAFPCHQSVLHGDPFRAVQIYTERLGVEGYKLLREKAYNGRLGKYPASYWRDETERLSKLLGEL